MFGFAKINQDAKRDEVQEEFVARVVNAAQDFVQAAGPAGAWPQLFRVERPCLDDALEAAHEGKLSLTLCRQSVRRHTSTRWRGAPMAGCTKSATTKTRWCWCAAGRRPRFAGAIAKVERRIRCGAAEAIPPYFERFRRRWRRARTSPSASGHFPSARASPLDEACGLASRHAMPRGAPGASLAAIVARPRGQAWVPAETWRRSRAGRSGLTGPGGNSPSILPFPPSAGTSRPPVIRRFFTRSTLASANPVRFALPPGAPA